MTTLAEISSVSRQLSRDFGTFFELNYASVGATIRLPHPLVQTDSVSVINNTDASPVTDYVLNSRNGLLKIPNPTQYEDGIYVSGLYFQWFLDEDFDFFSRTIATEHLHHRTSVSLESITGAEIEVMGIGALVIGMYSLLAEFATDIDIASPEGMSIPAHQRYQQTMSLVQYWEKRYEEKSALLNVGLKRIEMFTLRRKSRLTDRYVPLYRTREIDNPRPPIRVRPLIDPEEMTPFEDEEAFYGSSVENFSTESFDLGYGGWGTIGTGGAP
jgi:hypothetical protein